VTATTRALAAVAVLVALCAAAIPATARRRRSAASETPAPPVALVVERDFTPRVIAQGSVRLQAGARIEVGARISGVVEQLAVRQGSRVRRNDVIARLDARELTARVETAQARVDELDAAATQASVDVARLGILVRAGGATPQELGAAETARSMARARLAGAVADRDLASIQLGYTTIRAPIDGVVASVTTHEGETVAASLSAPTFVTLVAPTRLECVAAVDETDIAQVHVADAATFTVDGYPGREFSGRVDRIAPDASVIGGVVDYEVTIRLIGNVDGLKPQMTANVSLEGAHRSGLVIPTAALRQGSQDTYVWRRRGGRIERIPIRPGARQTDLTQILAGLTRGDTVLTGDFPDAK
jgi:HlyD family secretion protein